MKSRFRDNFQRVYEGIVLGLPHPEDRSMVERHECFLREFAHCPEAEHIRIRYRIATFALIMGVIVIGAIPTFAHIGSSQFAEVWWSWAVIVSSPLAFILPNSERQYVHLALKRRAKLAARSYPKLAEKLLWLFLPPETCEEAIDDINARFEKLRVRHDVRFARRWYRWQVVRSVSPTLDLLIERAIKWGIWAWIGRHF